MSYIVTIKRTEIYNVNIEKADSKHEAEDLALDKYYNDSSLYHDDTEIDVTVINTATPTKFSA